MCSIVLLYLGSSMGKDMFRARAEVGFFKFEDIIYTS
jgi:hypothetical protein